MDWQNYIELNREVMTGKPVFKGTRISVELVLERLGNGATDADVIESFPHLQSEHIRAAQAYAAVALSSEEMIHIDVGAP